MPMIHIEFDDRKVSTEEVQSLSKGIQKIVSEATHIEDVFVYANSAQIKIKIAPIEIFVRMTDHKITDEDELVKEIKVKLQEWKKVTNFQHSINFTLVPMHWKVEVGI